MKKHFLAVFFAVFLILPTAGHAQQYHPPQTDAEQALANLFEMEVGERNFLSTALNDFDPSYNPIKAQQYAPLFTSTFASNYRAESWEQYQDCAGSQSGLCFAPRILSCSMNLPVNKPLRTISDDGHIAQIAYSWEGEKDTGQYTMVNENGHWKLDNFSCLPSTP